MDTKQKRVYLWTAPRCLSTAFYRAIINAPGTLGIFEPFATAFTCGEERQIVRSSMSELPGYKFADIVSRLDQSYTGYDTIFVKDIAYSVMRSPYHFEELVPTGFVHTFLIRDPHESVRSLYNLSTKPELSGLDRFEAENSGFKDLFELYTYVTKQLCQKTIIIDACDLQENPGSALSSYCEFINIPFNRCMIDWTLADSSKCEIFKDTVNGFKEAWFNNAAESTMIHRKASTYSAQDLQSLPKIVRDTIQEQLPYYKLLHANRCRINQRTQLD